MMKGIIIFVVFVFAGCFAETPAPGILCGKTPEKILWCRGNPSIYSREIAAKCHQTSEDCEKMQCVFRESGWINDGKINKTKVASHFDQFAVEHSAWLPTVTHLKAACLGDHVLPPQGVHIGCPEYDIMYCAFISFLKYASPSQWNKSAECEYPRQFAASCPICPEPCFEQQVPIGSCNACLSLPRSA